MSKIKCIIINRELSKTEKSEIKNLVADHKYVLYRLASSLKEINDLTPQLLQLEESKKDEINLFIIDKIFLNFK